MLLFAAACWILVERKKDLGDRIFNAAYAVLSVIVPLAVGFTSVWLYANSFE